MDAPKWFLKELSCLDEHLRLRWSVKRELWMIERRVLRSIHPGTMKTDPLDDDVIRARDGYILVASVPPHGLSRQVLQKLKDSDLWANGGWRKIALAIETAEELEEERRWEAFSREMREYSTDLYEFLKLRDGRTVYNAGFVD